MGRWIVLAAVQTYRHARGRRWERHRAWAIRLFALAIGSWLYRLDYGFWLTVAARRCDWSSCELSRAVRHRDVILFLYLPNLAVAELFLRAGSLLMHRVLNDTATVIVLNAANFLVIVATYNIVHDYWGPAIIRFLMGRGG